MKLLERCPECNHPRDESKEFHLLETVFLSCGHKIHIEQLQVPEEETYNWKSLDGTQEAYEFQKENILKGIDANCNFMIADAMGLGKSVQAALILRILKDKLTPTIIIVKSATLYQWVDFIQKWTDNTPMVIYPIIGKAVYIPPGFRFYIISADSLKTNLVQLQGLHVIQPFQSCIMDECHMFKNDGSQRTRALIQLLTGKNPDDKYHGGNSFGPVSFKPVPHRIAMSGTPIKNRADEFFVALNLINPSKFPARSTFRYKWLRQNEKGQWSHLHPSRIEAFHEHIAPFYFRHEKTQVIKNLPAFSRHFDNVVIESEEFKNHYNSEIDLMQNFMESGATINALQMLGWLTKMRRLTGMMKVQFAIEFAREFHETCQLEKSVDSEYPDKLAIGIHHKDVLSSLKFAFDAHDRNNPDQKVQCLTLDGSDSAWEKSQIQQRFGLPQHKTLVISELAGGVGLNLQMCANTLVLERQWNAADEEQFESRFHRNGQIYPVTATYLIAHGTVDEFFHNMVEEKRRIFGDAICQWQFTNDNGGIKDLVEQTIRNKL